MSGIKVNEKLNLLSQKMLQWIVDSGYARQNRIRNTTISEKFGVLSYHEDSRNVEVRLRWLGHV